MQWSLFYGSLNVYTFFDSPGTVHPGLSSSSCHDKTNAKSVALAALVDSSPKGLNVGFTGRANFGFEVPSLISTGDNFSKISGMPNLQLEERGRVARTLSDVCPHRQTVT